MIELMAGWGIITPEKQGAFRRMVTEAGKEVSLPEEQLVGALGKGMPAIKALGWTPEQAITETAKIAATQAAPRARATMPANIFEAIMRPQIPKEFERKIPKEVREDPAKAFEWIRQRQGILSSKEHLKLLQSFYGAETGLGIYSWLTARPTGLERIIPEAAGPAGMTKETTQEQERMKTISSLAAESQNVAAQMDLQVEKDIDAQRRTRELGRAYRDVLLRDKKRKFRHQMIEPMGERYQEEYAAYRLWIENLTPVEKAKITSQWQKEGKPGLLDFEGIRYPTDIEEIPFKAMWRRMPWEEIAEQTNVAGQRQIQSSGPVIHYHNEQIFTPVVGNKADLNIGARFPKGPH
jgi:hypothetical protein